jgi:N-acylneuraminate cytidylyltransferase
MKCIAIIPARGGSKRIPRKNIKDFLGKPIISYSINVALKCGLFDEVMVSTDDEEIATISRSHGANVPFFRSVKNSNDFATTVDVIVEVIEMYKKELNKSFQSGCCIYPTAPFTSTDQLKNSYRHLVDKNFDSVFPVLKFGYPVQRALRIKDEKVTMLNSEFINSRSQDLEPIYHDSGQFYWFDINTLMIKRKMFSDNSGGIIISELEAQDIDNEIDWKLAELKYKLVNQID